MTSPTHPTLLQLNTRLWLNQRSAELGRSATLDDIPDAELDKLKNLGFEWLYLLSVWQTGEEGRRISRTNQAWRKEFEETLADLREEDIAGSGFAVKQYTVHEQLGGDAALARLRQRMARRRLLLMLDFVPNHTAPDHPWLDSHPDFFIQGTEGDLVSQPENYFRVRGGDGIFAYGRDPYFPGWPDTAQLNYANAGLREAMMRELLQVAHRCDGVRCDMAMLIVPEVFERTWGVRPAPFWPQALRSAKVHHPGFMAVAEVYWDMEWELQQQGFDFTYDKRLYDRLRERKSAPVLEHFCASFEYQSKLVRFLENHDEPRAAAVFAPEVHEAAAVLTYCAPGLRFLHQGQREGRQRRISPHLVRAPREPVDERLEKFYNNLLAILKRPAFHAGRWTLLECLPAWGSNESNRNYIAFSWEGGNREIYLIAVNFAEDRGQCFVKFPFEDLTNATWRLKDLFSDVVLDRNGNDLATRGLFLDEAPWKYYLLELIPLPG